MSVDTLVQFVIPAIGSFIAALLFVRWFVKRQPDRNCPECDTALPKWRKPTSFKQSMTGGWSCEKCGAELDRHGRKA